MKVIWTPEAWADRQDIVVYIAEDNPVAAVRMDQLFSDAAATLTQFSMRGRPGTIAGTRELIPHESYRLVYELEGETVWVLALVHASRQWPPIQDEHSER
ncbi:type II toxin-antitoxin system mRNA interferase toxin, RelE/StbE family [Salinicola halimionae]|uniref:type II toxin-antitoxin system mRNA interferase toxin, RelE/StbE family n=1 Tax=Salinicola halimionae TaxID=1949081 RepID=UPI000DA24DDF